MRALRQATLAALALLAANAARAESLVLSLSRENVLIQSNFTGERLSLFGVVEGGESGATYDVVVTVRGPRGAVTVRRKDLYGPMWLNIDERKYIAIPAFLSVLSNRPLQLIAPAPIRDEFRIGIDAQVPQQIASRDANDPRFREALQRLRREQALFNEHPAAVRLIAPSVFQASIELPGTAPIGNYDIETIVFANGAVAARGASQFRVAKTATEQTVATIAAEHGLWFGVATALLALVIGWLASVVFRRD